MRPPAYGGWQPPNPLAIASGALRAEIEAVLGAAGLASCFHAIVAIEDVAHGKPSPEPYLRAVAALAVPPSEALAIEDSPGGVTSARTAGLRVIALEGSRPARELGDADRCVASALNKKLWDLGVGAIWKGWSEQGGARIDGAALHSVPRRAIAETPSLLDVRVANSARALCLCGDSGRFLMPAGWQRPCGTARRGVGLRRVRAAVSGDDRPVSNCPGPF